MLRSPKCQRIFVNLKKTDGVYQCQITDATVKHRGKLQILAPVNTAHWTKPSHKSPLHQKWLSCGVVASTANNHDVSLKLMHVHANKAYFTESHLNRNTLRQRFGTFRQGFDINLKANQQPLTADTKLFVVHYRVLPKLSNDLTITVNCGLNNSSFGA